MSAETRTPVISRVYGKGADLTAIYVYRISGGDIDGTVFQYAVFLDNVEQIPEQVTSGNQYAVRKAFINKLLDLHEDGWARRNAGVYSADAAFFNPELL